MQNQQINIIFLIFAKLVCNNKSLEAFLSKLKGTQQELNISYEFVPKHQIRIRSLSASKQFTCAIDYESALFCWWDAKQNEKMTKISIDGLQKGISRLVTGRHTVCAENIYLAVELRCFSNNGINGNGFELELEIPSDFNSGLTDFSIGTQFMCVVKLYDSDTHCWEQDTNYKIKDTVVDVPKGLRALKIHVSDEIACAISEKQDIQCWSLVNKLGDGLNFYQDGQFTMVQAGKSQFCAIDSKEALHCWNNNGAVIEMNETMLNNNNIISLQQNRICSIKTDKSFVCWDFKEQVLSNPFRKVNLISLGLDHYCITQDEDIDKDRIYCQYDSLSKMKMAILDDLLINTYDIKVGSSFHLAIDSSGNLKLNWIQPGEGSFIVDSEDQSGGMISVSKFYFCAISKSALINCQYINQDKKQIIELDTPKIKGAIKLSVSDSSVCVILISKKLYCWIYLFNLDNKLKIDHNSNMILTNKKVNLVAVFQNFTCASQNVVTCWSSDKSIKIFNVQVLDLQASNRKLCQVTIQHELKCYHIIENSFKTDPIEIEVPLPYQKNIKAVSLYNNQVCNINTDNELACWIVNSLNNVQVPKEARKNVKSVSVGKRYICSRNDADSKLNCWYQDDE